MLCVRLWGNSGHLIPTTILMNRYPSPLFLQNEPMAWEGEVTGLQVVCCASGRDGILNQGSL